MFGGIENDSVSLLGGVTGAGKSGHRSPGAFKTRLKLAQWESSQKTVAVF